MRLRRIGLLVLVAIVVIGIGVRAAAPSLVRRYVVRTLNRIEGYRAEVGDVDLHIWRGAYSISPLRLERVTGKVAVPFFESQRIDLSVEWRAIFDGALVGKLGFEDPRLNFVKGPTPEHSQTSAPPTWKEALKDLFPLKFNRVTIQNGEIHYRDFFSSPKVDVYLQDITATAMNLSNSKRLTKTLIANVYAKGRPQKSGTFDMRLDVNPWTDTPTFSLDAKVEKIALRELNSLLKAYGNFDVESGDCSLYIEVASEGNRFKGYVKPILTDVRVLRWESDSKNPIQYVWEGIIAGLVELLENQNREQVATRIPLEGSFEDPETDLIQTIWGVIHNAFVKALMGSLENSVSLSDVEGGDGGSEEGGEWKKSGGE